MVPQPCHDHSGGGCGGLVQGPRLCACVCSREGVTLYINTCGEQGRALGTAAGNLWSGCFILACVSGIHAHLLWQRAGLCRQAAATAGPRSHRAGKHGQEVGRGLCFRPGSFLTGT